MTILGVFIGLIIIGLMMLVHEAGHFLAGKLLNFKIIEFSIFMGPRLFSTEKGGIKYSFKLLPIGASVQFAGEYPESSDFDQTVDADDPGLFFNRPRWARAIVVAMGPIANFFTAFLASIILFASFGVAIPIADQPPGNSLAYEQGLEAGDKILRLNGERIRTSADYSMVRTLVEPDQDLILEIQKPSGERKELILKPGNQDNYRLGIVQSITGDQKNMVLSVDPESNQGNPVLQEGDILLTVNDIPFSDPQSAFEIAQSSGEQVKVKVNRSGQELELAVKTTLYNDPIPDGIFFTESRAIGDIVYQALQYPWSIVKSTVKGISMIFGGQMKFSESVTGPVGLVKMFSDVVSENAKTANLALAIYQLLFYFILISVAIGFTNLLPIPPLDGHHLLILAIEGIRRKDLPDRFKHVIAAVGMILILTLAAIVIYLDIRRIF